jgi:CheY-like chemotaxis protein
VTEEAEKIASAGASARGERVLIVDDERAVLTYAEKVLQRAGYQVRAASDGGLALDIFDEQREELSLIILDLTMPNQSGLEVLQEVRARDRRIPVILCTGYAQGGVDEALLGDVQGFLKKPYSPRDMLEQVREVLDAAGPGSGASAGSG